MLETWNLAKLYLSIISKKLFFRFFEFFIFFHFLANLAKISPKFIFTFNQTQSHTPFIHNSDKFLDLFPADLFAPFSTATMLKLKLMSLGVWCLYLTEHSTSLVHKPSGKVYSPLVLYDVLVLKGSSVMGDISGAHIKTSDQYINIFTLFSSELH